MTIPRQLAALLASAALLVAVAGCGEEPVSYSDKDIIDRLNLEKSGDGDRYAVDGDPFCEVEAKLLNSADEVEEGAAGRNGDLVLTSRVGNVGVKVLPGFAPDCQNDARKKLDKLDPRPEG